MSISLLPIRLGNLRLERPVRKHRAVDEVARLRLELDQLNRALVWANLRIKTQRVQLDDAAARQTGLEEQAVQQQADIDDLTAERDQLDEELAALKRRFGPELAAEANANAITVPLMHRDTTALEDQATAPIPVLTLQQAFGSTDPAHVPAWAKRD